MKKVSLMIVCLMVMSMTANAVIVTFQEGVNSYTGTEDTYLSSYYNHFNYGAWFRSLAGEYVAGRDGNALFRFTGLESLAGKTINSAKIVLQGRNPEGGFFDITVYQVHDDNADWIEGTNTGSVIDPLNPSADWDRKIHGGSTNTVNWAGGTNGCGIAGTDYYTTPLDSVLFDGANTAYQEVEAAIPAALVAQWASGGVNAGIIIVRTEDPVVAPQRMYFKTSDEGEIAARPMLVVDYVPEPATIAILGLGGLLIRRKR